MNGKLFGIIRVTNSVIKFSILQLTHGSSVHVSLKNLISPYTEITVDRGGRLAVGPMLRMRSASKIRVRKGAVLNIGKDFNMGNGCIIAARDRIEIGEHSSFGPGVLVYDHDHDFRVEGGRKANKYQTSPISIGKNVWVGANCIILRGSKIGDNCVVAAGTIVRGEYPANTMIYQKRETTIRQISLG